MPIVASIVYGSLLGALGSINVLQQLLCAACPPGRAGDQFLLPFTTLEVMYHISQNFVMISLLQFLEATCGSHRRRS